MTARLCDETLDAILRLRLDGLYPADSASCVELELKLAGRLLESSPTGALEAMRHPRLCSELLDFAKKAVTAATRHQATATASLPCHGNGPRVPVCSPQVEAGHPTAVVALLRAAPAPAGGGGGPERPSLRVLPLHPFF